MVLCVVHGLISVIDHGSSHNSIHPVPQPLRPSRRARCPSFTGTGGGTVNTQTYIGTYETYTLVVNDDGTISFKSTVFDNVFLASMRLESPRARTSALAGALSTLSTPPVLWSDSKFTRKMTLLERTRELLGLSRLHPRGGT